MAMTSDTPKRLYEFGPFQLDAAEHVLLRAGKPVALTPKAFETLLVLVQNSGHVVEKETIINAVWPDTAVEENIVAVNVSLLRKTLGTGENGEQYIDNVPKRGYRFVPSVREISHENNGFPQGSKPSQAVKGSAPGADAGHEEPVSIAVLPFMNASHDASMDYLSDGMTESIINSLSQLTSLRVMARSTVFRYKAREVDPQEIGNKLNVRAVLTGRVLQRGETLNIQTELVDVGDGSQLWGEQYNLDFSDLFAVQEEIARVISEKLLSTLSGEQKKRLAKRYTESPEAYRIYLMGRFYWSKRTLEGLKKGVEYFQQAIDKDPYYALAYTGLADSYALLGSVEYSALPPAEAMPKARAAAIKALEVDDALAEAHASVAYVHIFDWHWYEAERAYRRAIELNPNYATAHHWYAMYLGAMGRHDEALEEIKLAQELDPLSLPISVGVGWHFFLTRQYHRAVEEYRKTLEMDPNFYMAHFLLGLAHEQESRFDEAIAAYQQAQALSNGHPLMIAAPGHAYAALGQRDEAQAVLDQLAQLAKRRYVSPYYIAAIYTGLCEKEQALAWLDQACESRSEGLVWLKVDPLFDSLRADARFADLLHRVGLGAANA
jgi:TolB-like protein/Flp pilus assembly protein TadD